jgi:hypothetical protein
MLYLPDDDGQELWRVHERYAVTVEEWPAPPYAALPAEPLVVLLDTTGRRDGWGHAQALGRELGLPLIPAELAGRVDLIALVADSPSGAIVAGPLADPAFELLLPRLEAAIPGAIRSGGGGGDGDGSDWDARSVTRLALELRAAARTGT